MGAKSNLVEAREIILALAAQYGINRVRIFGSVARGEETLHSDLDLLVNFDEDRSLLDLIGFRNKLEEVLDRKVDVVSENALHWYIKDKVIQEAVEL